MTRSEPFPETPVLISSVVTANEADAVTGRLRNITPAHFQYRMQEQQRNTQAHAAELVSYIAWEPTGGTIDGLTVEVRRTADAVRDAFYTIAFATVFITSPRFVADMQSADGGDPAALRWRNKKAAGVEVKVEQEQSRNRNTKHTTEVVGYIAIQ